MRQLCALLLLSSHAFPLLYPVGSYRCRQMDRWIDGNKRSRRQLPRTHTSASCRISSICMNAKVSIPSLPSMPSMHHCNHAAPPRTECALAARPSPHTQTHQETEQESRRHRHTKKQRRKAHRNRGGKQPRRATSARKLDAFTRACRTPLHLLCLASTF